MYQYIHLIQSSGASLPIDIWHHSNTNVKPELADQVAVGLSFIFNDKYLLSNEFYYKQLQNQLDYKDGANLFLNDDLDKEFVYGKGWGYGNEIYLEKTSGKLRGWLGYTLSWSWRQFDDINKGKRFAPRYDRRHDASAVLIYELSKKINFSAAWVYGTGNAVSLPSGYFVRQNPIEGDSPDIIPIYTERNNYRMPAYHRLDLGMVWHFYPKWGVSDLTFSVFNAYSRKNAYFIYLKTTEIMGDPTGFSAKQVSLFPVLPTFTYNFKF